MLKCFEGENTSMCEAIRQMIDEGIMLGEKRGEMQIVDAAGRFHCAGAARRNGGGV